MSEIDLSTSILRRKLDCRRELYVMTPFVQTRSLLRKHGQRTSIYALTAPASSLCELSPRVLVRLIESQISTIYICPGMSISSLGARRPWDYSKRICSRIHKNPSRYEFQSILISLLSSCCYQPTIRMMPLMVANSQRLRRCG